MKIGSLRNCYPGAGGRSLNVSIGIATRGRPSILKETLRDLAAQSHPPSVILVAYLETEDIAGLAHDFPGVAFIKGSGGLCAQRNLLLKLIDETHDIILFIDDDFYLHSDYIQRVCETFEEYQDAIGVTGTVLADGAKGPGLTVEYARTLLASIRSVATLSERAPAPAYNTYGCNMAFRLHTLRLLDVHFDEQLPAYGWYEDLDFSRRLLPHGKLFRIPGAQGVHLGVKMGRTSGKRLGYSQVANPIYLARKGSYPARRASGSVLRNLLANLLRSLWPEPYIDRRGRLQGNFLALLDLLRNRMRPDRILSLR